MVFSKLHEVLYSEDRDMVRKTSLNILKQFWRHFETNDKSCQTFDGYIEELKTDV